MHNLPKSTAAFLSLLLSIFLCLPAVADYTVLPTKTPANVFLRDGTKDMTGPLDMNNHRIVDVTNPSANQDAATKYYVDAVAAGLSLKQSVRAATTGSITLSGEQTIDDVSVVSGDRVLVKNFIDEASPANGIYIVSTGAWTRATDADISSEVTAGMFTFVEEGTTNASSGWVLATANPITLDTTWLIFTQFSSAGAITPGDGLSQSGQDFNVGGTASRISVSADNVDIDASYAGQTSINTLGTVGTGTWQGTPVGIPYGGSGQNYSNVGDVSAVITANTTLTKDSESVVLVNSGGGTFALTLPLAATCPGKLFVILNSGMNANTVNINRQGSDLIDNGTTKSTPSVASRAVVSDGVDRWTSVAPGWHNGTTGGQGGMSFLLTPGTLGAGPAGNTGQMALSGSTGPPTWSSTAIGTGVTTAPTLSLGATFVMSRSLDCASNPITVTLPDATVAGNLNKEFILTKVDSTANAVTVNTTSGQTISQFASGALQLTKQWQTVALYCNGANWIIRKQAVQRVEDGGTGTTWAGNAYSPAPATLTTNTTLTNTSPTIVIGNSTAGGFQIDLPAASTAPGKEFTFINIGTSNNITVSRAGGDTINNAVTTFVVGPNNGVFRSVISDGVSRWLAPYGSFGNQALSGSVPYFRNAGALDVTAVGTSGQRMLSGAGSSPTWSSTVEGTLTTTATTLTIATSSVYSQKLDCASNNITVTLPSATTGANLNKELIFTKIDSSANTVTFNTTSGQTISQFASGALQLTKQWQTVALYCDGANWIIRKQAVQRVEDGGTGSTLAGNDWSARETTAISKVLTDDSPRVQESTAAVTYTLPAITAGVIKEYLFVMSGLGTRTFATTGGDTVMGGASPLTIASGGSYKVLSLISDGVSSWLNPHVCFSPAGGTYTQGTAVKGAVPYFSDMAQIRNNTPGTTGQALRCGGTGAPTFGVLAELGGGTGTTLFTSGQATFATAGSVDVADATITASSIIVVTETGTGAVDRYSVTVNAGVGFTIYSSNGASTAVVNYVRLK